MEALSCLIDRAVAGGFISSYHMEVGMGMGKLSPIWYMQMGNLVFFQADLDQLAYFSWLLMWFGAISWLKINLNKSEIIPIGNVDNVEVLALELGCKVGALPSSYLGLPLGAHHGFVAVWDGIEEMFRKKVTLWNRQYISKGGRITLIGSTLSCLPICFMSFFRLPKRVRLRLDRIQRDFL